VRRTRNRVCYAPEHATIATLNGVCDNARRGCPWTESIAHRCLAADYGSAGPIRPAIPWALARAFWSTSDEILGQAFQSAYHPGSQREPWSLSTPHGPGAFYCFSSGPDCQEKHPHTFKHECSRS